MGRKPCENDGGSEASAHATHRESEGSGELKLQREELDKMDGVICDGFQDAGDDCDSFRAPALSKSSRN